MRKLIFAACLLAFPSVGMAQATTSEKSRLETECSQRPGSAACAELRRELPPTTTGTIPGPATPNRPGSGATGSSDGTAGAGAGGVTPQGNPANSGGSPRSSQ